MSERTETDLQQGTLVVDAELCHGCQTCMVTCSLVKEGRVIPSLARIQVVLDPFEGEHLIHYCRQCRQALCAESCPEEAIQWIEGKGFWSVDEDLCVGCGLCADACPFEAIFLSPTTQKALKCDTCYGRPECVQSCPRGALTWVVKTDPQDS